MKQYITREQFNELSKENQKYLQQWGEKKGFDDDLPQLTIGQMLEFLDDQWKGSNKQISFVFKDMAENTFCDALFFQITKILDELNPPKVLKINVYDGIGVESIFGNSK